MGKLKHRSAVFSQHSQIHEMVCVSSLNLFVIFCCFLLPRLLWHDKVTWSRDVALHRLPFAQGLLMKSHWRRLFLLAYHQNFLLCSWWLWSTRWKKCCSVSYLTSHKASLSVQRTVFASKCIPSSPPASVVFAEWVQHVINQHLGEILTMQQSNKKKHTFQMQQLKGSKLTHGLKSPKWSGCQTTVSTSNFLGSKVEFCLFRW